MSKLLLFVFLIVITTTTSLMAQQTGSVRGRVTTSDGSIAEGVTVKLKGTDLGSVTNEDGQYHIRRVPAGSYTLIVSAVGLYPKEKQIKSFSQ